MKALTDLIARVAELERRLSRTRLHGPVTDRKKFGKQWKIRVRIGGTDEEPMKTPWISYNQIAGDLKVHWVPKVGQQMTVDAPDGVPEQANAVPMWWSDDIETPSEDPDAVVITHRGDQKFRLTLKDGVMHISHSDEIKFESREKITFIGGGSEVEIKAGHINVKADKVHTVGVTHLGVNAKDEDALKRVDVEGLLLADNQRVYANPGEPDPKVAEMEAAIAAAAAAAAAAGDGNGDGGA